MFYFYLRKVHITASCTNTVAIFELKKFIYKIPLEYIQFYYSPDSFTYRYNVAKKREYFIIITKILINVIENVFLLLVCIDTIRNLLADASY